MFLKTGFWSDKKYFLNKMTLRDLVSAYFQYYAIQAYIVGGILFTWLAFNEPVISWKSAVAAALVVVLYPAIWYVLHRWMLHSQYLYKSPLTARTWKRIHFDHHMDPHDLAILFGALYTTMPAIFLASFPIGYAFDGMAGAYAAFASGLFTTCFYEFCHCIQHLSYKPKYEFLKKMKARHMAHHFQDESGNFGITNFVPDKIFGTFYEREERPVKSETVFNLGYTNEVADVYPWVRDMTPNMQPDVTPRDRRQNAA